MLRSIACLFILAVLLPILFPAAAYNSTDGSLLSSSDASTFLRIPLARPRMLPLSRYQSVIEWIRSRLSILASPREAPSFAGNGYEEAHMKHGAGLQPFQASTTPYLVQG